MAVRPPPLDPKMKMTTDIPTSIITPDSFETRLGTLKFKDGVPDAATTQKLYDEFDYIHAVDAFINGYPLVRVAALPMPGGHHD